MLLGREAESWRELAARLVDGRSEPVTGLQAIAPTPFQSGAWLSAWYDTLGAQPSVRPLPIEIIDERSGQTIAGLPLVQRNVGGMSVVEFADFCVTDYNAPVLASDRDIVPEDFLSAIAEALPAADVLHLMKMPPRLGGLKNPLVDLKGVRQSEVQSHSLRIESDWEHYQRQTLSKKFRKEMERSLRVFHRDGDNARFEVIKNYDVAEWVLGEIEALQEARITGRGLPYQLNDAHFRAFYRNLLRTSLDDGSVVMTALRSGTDRIVAGLIGLYDGRSYAMVRLAQDSENWSQCSPGKLLIERTIHMLHGEGLRHFDFTTGDYSYKNGFCIEQSPLYDISVPLSLRGRVKLHRETAVEDVKSRLRRYPRVYDTIKTIAGRSTTQ